MAKPLTDYFLYRHRKILGYILVCITLAGLLTASVLVFPNGLRSEEMTTATMSADLSKSSLGPSSVIDLPYRVLQKVSFMLFGFTELSIKLPSLILAATAAIGIVLLLARWFRPNVAVAATVVTITSTYFLFAAQDGTPAMLTITLSVWLLLSALLSSRLTHFATLWKVIMFTLAALLLYVPLGIYLVIALATATLLHPHLRFLIKRMSRLHIIIALAIGLGLLAPLIFAVIIQPSIILTLLGIPSAWPDFGANASLLMRELFGFWLTSDSALVWPLVPIGSFILMMLGAYRLVTIKYTARSYILWAWLPLVCIGILCNPTLIYHGFLVGIFLTVMGLDVLISHWYSLFPRNPYARVAGLFPLSIIVVGLMMGGLTTYLYAYHFTPSISSHFHHDLSLVNQLIAHEPSATSLVVAPEEVGFYSVVAREHNLTLQTVGDTTIATRAADRQQLGEPVLIVTDAHSTDADRFYLYKKSTN